VSISSAWSIAASRPSSTTSMSNCVASGGRLAICRASGRGASSVSPSPVSWFTRPKVRHSGAGIWGPRIMNSSASVRPLSRGQRWVPPNPGMIPRFVSVWPIRAVSFSRRKWHAMAISHPPPNAWPFIAAMTGLGKRSILRSTPLPKRMKALTSPPAKAEPRSAPAQKIRSPLPVMITERTVVSCSTEASAAARSRMSCSLIAFAGGRFSVSTTNDSSRANSSVSNAIGRDSLEKDRRYRLGGVAEPVGALAEHPRRRDLIHGAEQHLGGELDGQIAAHLAAGDALLQHAADQLEVGGHLVGGRAAEELVALTQLDLHDLGEGGIAVEHAEGQGHQPSDLRDGVGLTGDLASCERDPLGHLVAEQRDEDLVLRLEVKIDGAAGDAGLARDVRHARVEVAGPRE